MKKRNIKCLISAATLGVLLLPPVGVNAEDNNPASDFSCVELDDGMLLFYTGVSTDVVVPSEFNGLPVTEIVSLKKDITSIVLPPTLLRVGAGAFLSCTNLSEILLPEGVTRIDDAAFKRSSIKSIYIPKNVNYIGRKAFSFCSDLVSITVDEENSDFSSEDGVLFDKEKTTLLFYPSARQSEDYEVPQSVTSLGEASFLMSRLKSVHLPVGITEISSDAFSLSCDLKQIICDGNITKVGQSAFGACSSLEEFPFDDCLESIGNSAFSKCTGLQSLIIPDSVNSLGTRAFASCTGLKEISIGSGINQINPRLFMGCTNLVSIRTKNEIITIGDNAFQGCTSLAQIECGNQLQAIGRQAFAECTKLETILLPRTLNALGVEAFEDCTSLKSIYFKGDIPEISYYIDPILPISFPYPTIYYLEGTAGWSGEYFIKSMRSNWWTKNATVGTWTLPADEPEVFVSQRTVKNNKVEMTLVFGGVLQSSSDLKNWGTVATESPYQVSEPATPGQKFYRTIAKEPAE